MAFSFIEEIMIIVSFLSYRVGMRHLIIGSYLLVGVEANKPCGKREQVVWRLECELGIISDSECPVDGGWTPWSPWSACRGPCDDIGHRRRGRECANPPPSQDGLPCSGVDQEVETCYLKDCTIEDYHKIVEGDAIRTEALHQLKAVPALMQRCLLVQCPYEDIETALATDNTWSINPESLWNSLQCVKQNLGCPAVGEWGAWGAWSACGARCGYGLRWRLRRCDTPPPSNAHLICSGTPLQADECQGDQCALNKRDFGGTWSEWGIWSLCSENCGTGVRRRKRTCFEINKPQLFGSWGTHCRGQHDQLEVCESRECDLDGNWSGWGTWGPCSQSCGAGRRIRSRSCTRPVPAGRGALCSGPRTEVGSCHIGPCESYYHTVAVFNGESFLQYNFENKRSTLLHFYVRFLPLSPHGTLVRRGSVRNPLIRLSLQKWHICLDAGGTSRSCTIPRICSQTAIEPAVWHSALVTLTSEAATLRLDDTPVRIRSTFPCDPDLPDEKMNIYVGERLHGEIQELILNFIPLSMIIENSRSSKSSFCPSSGSNVAYEKAGLEEAHLSLNNDQYLRLPCYSNQEEWRIDLTLKSKRESGTILFLQDELKNSWLHLSLQNMRLKLKLAFEDFRSESSSSTECLPDQWFDVSLSKKPEANTIEASINARERLHVLFDDYTPKDLKDLNKSYNIKGNHENIRFKLCTDEYFLGGVPISFRERIPEDFNTFSGVIASMSVNDALLDLHDFSKERYKDGKIQVSSRTASISGSYHETAWGKSNLLNLTCLRARTARSPNTAHWMYLDVIVSGSLKEKNIRSTDDGRVLRLVATTDNDLRGFYTCRANNNKRTINIVTYGVLGKMQHKITGPDMTTAVAVVFSLALVLGSLAWLFIEGIHDLRNGYGFFRDAHLSPEEEAEAVCKYIDQNIHLVGTQSAAKIAKAKARRIGKQLASRASFSAQEPQGLMQFEYIPSNETMSSEPEVLPALPEVKMEHDVFRFEESYVSSPRPGSLTSPRTKLTSSTSFAMVSPRALCSRLLLNKRMHSSHETLTSRKHISRIPPKARSKLLTIKSSSFVNQSLAHKILQKFGELKSEDP